MILNNKNLLKNFDRLYEEYDEPGIIKFKQISKFHILTFLKQLTQLLDSGIDLSKSLEIIIKCEKNPQLQEIIREIHTDVANGEKLSISFMKHPDVFNNLTCNFIAIGETSGKLTFLLNKAVENQEKSLALINKIKSAMVYPLIISITAVLITILMLVLVIPKFNEIFVEMQVSLPPFTRWVIFASNIIKQNFYIIIILSLVYIILFNLKLTNKYIVELNEKIINAIPGINYIKKHKFLTMFAQSLSIMLASGLSIDTGLKFLSSSIDKRYQNYIKVIKLDIEHGSSLFTALEKTHIYPTVFLQMVKIGEETGNLDTMLDKVSKLYTEELDYFINRLSQLIEPLIITVLGVLIGGLVIAIYLPIFNLGNIL